MTRSLPTLLLLGGLLALTAGGRAQDKPAPPKAQAASPKTQRAVYTARHSDPAALAEILAKHFKGDAEVSAVPTGTGAVLLVSGPATADAVKLLEQIDRQPKTVSVEVVLVDVTLKKGEDGKEAPEPDVTGSAADVAAKLDALRKAGQIASLQRIQLTTVEGQPVSSTTGGNKPIVTAVVGGGFGGRGGAVAPAPMQRSVTYHQAGTTVKLTAWARADNAVTLDLKVEDSRVKPPADGDEVGAAIDTSVLTTQVSVPAGRAVVAQSVRVDGKVGRTLSLVIVSARATEAGTVASR